MRGRGCTVSVSSRIRWWSTMVRDAKIESCSGMVALTRTICRHAAFAAAPAASASSSPLSSPGEKCDINYYYLVKCEHEIIVAFFCLLVKCELFVKCEDDITVLYQARLTRVASRIVRDAKIESCSGMVALTRTICRHAALAAAPAASASSSPFSSPAFLKKYFDCQMRG